MSDRTEWPAWGRESNRPGFLVVSSLLLLGCGASDSGATPQETDSDQGGEALFPLTHMLSAAEAEELRAYSWDGGIPVELDGARGPLLLDASEVGLTSDTRLYLPMNEGRGMSTRDTSHAGRSIALDTWSWTAGRFGHGLQRDSGTPPLSIELGMERPWTIELYVRLDSTAPATLIAVPEGPRVGIDGKSRVFVQWEVEGGPMLRCGPPLEGGRWHRIALAYDGPDLSQVRLAVGEETRVVAVKTPLPLQLLSLIIGAEPDGTRGLTGAIDDLRVTARAAMSGELAEAARTGVPAGEHLLRLELRSEIRELRPWAGVQAAPRLASSGTWKCGVLVHVAASVDGIEWAPAQWERDQPPSPPAARTTHPTVYVGDERIFIYGGETRDTDYLPLVNTDDTWIYHAGEQRWERVASDGPAPSPRCHMAAAWSPDHRLVLLAGGFRFEEDSNPVFSDTWVYYPDEDRWEERHPEGDPFPKISNNGIVYHPPSRRFVSIMSRCVLVYDPEADRWERRPRPKAVFEDTGQPSDHDPAGCPAIGYDPASGRIVLFGGESRAEEGGHSYHAVTALYDVEENMIFVRSPEVSPSPRTRAGFAWDSKRDRFVLFGGVKDWKSVREMDLWTYHVGTNTWTELECANRPSRRGGYFGMAYVPNLDRFFLLCGRHGPNRWLNEAWRLHLDETAVGTATYVFDFDMSGPPGRWFADTDVPEGASVSFRFAGSSDSLSWSPWVDDDRELAGTSFVKVEIRMVPGPNVAGPRVRAMGWR